MTSNGKDNHGSDPAPFQAALGWCPAFLLFLGAAIGSQWFLGAYHVEFGGYPDEPAHYVTGLMIRDYLAAGAPAAPMQFAEEYYLHYPKVAFGMWGPLFHVLIGFWTLLFSPARAAVLILMAVITAALATLLYTAARRHFHPASVIVAALAFIALGPVRLYGSMIMADTLVALLDFAAALAFAEFVQSGRARDSAKFGVFAALSILTKGNGVALIFLPPMALILSRRLALIRRPSFWLAPAIVLATAAPWQLYSVRLLANIHQRSVTSERAIAYSTMTLTLLGWALLPVVLTGIYDRVIQPYRRARVEPVWASAVSLIVAVWAFHCMIPAASFVETRYLIALAPPLLMFLTAGISRLAALLPGTWPPGAWRTAALTGMALLLLAPQCSSVPPKAHFGYAEVAQDLITRCAQKPSTFLVSADAVGEGMFVAEIAMRDRRPRHVVLRVTKMLGQADWNGERYRLRYHNSKDLMAFLHSIPVDVVILDQRARAPHDHLLAESVRAYPEEWERLGQYPHCRAAGGCPPVIEWYRLKAAATLPRGKIRIDMPYTLGRPIER